MNSNFYGRKAHFVDKSGWNWLGSAILLLISLLYANFLRFFKGMVTMKKKIFHFYGFHLIISKYYIETICLFFVLNHLNLLCAANWLIVKIHTLRYWLCHLLVMGRMRNNQHLAMNVFENLITNGKNVLISFERLHNVSFFRETFSIKKWSEINSSNE